MRTAFALLVTLTSLLISPALAQDSQPAATQPGKNVLSTDLGAIGPDYKSVSHDRAKKEEMFILGVILALTAGSWLCLEVGKRRKQTAS